MYKIIESCSKGYKVRYASKDPKEIFLRYKQIKELSKTKNNVVILDDDDNIVSDKEIYTMVNPICIYICQIKDKIIRYLS